MKGIIQSFALILLLMVAYQPLTHAQSPDQAESKPEVLGVLMYADWCSKCQELDPKLPEVKPQFQDQSILFIQFDMTNDFTTSQSGKLAGLLGLSDLFQKHKGRTGYMVLLDAQTHEVLKTLKHNQSQQELRKKIDSVLQ